MLTNSGKSTPTTNRKDETERRLPELQRKSIKGNGGNEPKDISRTFGARTDPKLLPRLNSREKQNLFSMDATSSLVDPLGREIDKEVISLDVHNKIRDLEAKFLDFKGNMERRIIQMIEENPQKFLSHLKIVEEKNNGQWKDNSLKQNSLQDVVMSLREGFKNSIDNVNVSILELQKNVQDCIYKCSNNERSIEGLTKIQQQVAKTPLLAIENRSSTNPNTPIELQTQLSILRESIQSENARKDGFLHDIMRMYQDLNNEMHRYENEFLTKLTRQKDEMNDEFQGYKEHWLRKEDLKAEKFFGESEYMKQLIKQMESRIEDEVEKRLRTEFESKQWLDMKISNFKEELRGDERQFLQGEQKFVQQVQESFSSLTHIIKSSKEQLEADLAATQTLFNENIKSLSKTIDLLKENMFSKMGILDNNEKELAKKVYDTQRLFHEHAQSTNNVIDKEFTRIQKVTTTFEEILNRALKEQDLNIQKNEANIENWKVDYDKRSYQIFTEIRNNLKTVKTDIQKERVDKNEQLKALRGELYSYQEMNQNLLKNLEDHTKKVDEQLEFRLKEYYVKTNEDLNKESAKLSSQIDQTNKATYDKITAESAASLKKADDMLRDFIVKEDLKSKAEFGQLVHETREILKNEVFESERKIEKKVQAQKEENERQLNEHGRKLKECRDTIENVRNEGKEDLRKVVSGLEANLMSATTELKILVNQKLNETAQETDEKLDRLNQKLAAELETVKKYGDSHLRKLHERIKGEITQEGERVILKFEERLREEQATRDQRIQEVANQIQNVKNMLLETISKKTESLKALIRALVTEEAAERERAIENLLKLMKQSITALEQMLRSLITSSIEQLRAEFWKMLEELERKFMEHKIWTIEEITRIQKELDEHRTATAASEYLLFLYRKKKEEEYDITIRNIEEKFIDMDNRLIDESVERVFWDAQFKSLFVIHKKQLWLNKKELETHRDQIMTHQSDLKKMYNDYEAKIYLMDLYETVDSYFHQRKFHGIKQRLDHHDRNSNDMQIQITNNDNSFKRFDLNIQSKMYLNELYTFLESIENFEMFYDHEERLNEQYLQITQHDELISRHQRENASNLRELNVEIESKIYLDELYIKLLSEENYEVFGLHENKLKENGSTLQNHQNALKKNEDKINMTSEDFTKWRNDIENNVDKITEGMYEMDDKFTKSIEDLWLDNHLKAYVKELYDKLSAEQANEKETYTKAKLNKISYQIQQLSEGLSNLDKEVDDFETRTNNNFSIYEKGLKDYGRFLNELDARLTIEEIYSKVVDREMETDFIVKTEQLNDDFQEVLRKLNILKNKFDEEKAKNDSLLKELAQNNSSVTDSLIKKTEEILKKIEEHDHIIADSESNQRDMEGEVLLLKAEQTADLENLKEYVQQGFGAIEEIIEKFKTIEIQDIDLKEFTTLVNERMQDRDTKEQTTVKAFDDKIDSVKTEINLVNENLGKKIEENSQNSKKTTEIIQRLGNELRALESKHFVNKE